MATNNLFDNNSNVNLDDVSGEQALSDMVGEGKKYATPEDMAKAMLHGQAHISQLENENGDFRSKAEQAKGVNDILAALKQGSEHQSTDQQNQDDNQSNASDTPDVQALIDTAFAARDAKVAQGTADKNKQTVLDSLTKSYGHEAARVYEEVGSSLGISLDDLAAKSPQAVLNLVAQARPSQSNSGLPESTQRKVDFGNNGLLTQATINTMYKDGKIKNLTDKHRMEHEQLTALGHDKFYS
jgi:hypothetical protein